MRAREAVRIAFGAKPEPEIYDVIGHPITTSTERLMVGSEK